MNKEDERATLMARMDAMQLLIQINITALDPAARIRLRETFDAALTKWREMLVMSRASEAHLLALEREHFHWLSRFSEADRDAQPPPSA